MSLFVLNTQQHGTLDTLSSMAPRLPLDFLPLLPPLQAGTPPPNQGMSDALKARLSPLLSSLHVLSCKRCFSRSWFIFFFLSVSILLIKITCWAMKMYQCLGHMDRNSDLLGLHWDFSWWGVGVVFSFNIFFKAPRLS